MKGVRLNRKIRYQWSFAGINRVNRERKIAIGFLDSFNQSFYDESDRLSTKRQKVEEKEMRFNSLRDGDLLERIRHAHGENKYIIERILKERGYRINADGVFERE